MALECMYFFDARGEVASAQQFSRACRMLGYEVRMDAAQAALALVDPEGEGTLRIPALCEALRFQAPPTVNSPLKSSTASKQAAPPPLEQR